MSFSFKGNDINPSKVIDESVKITEMLKIGHLLSDLWAGFFTRSGSKGKFKPLTSFSSQFHD